MKTKLAVSALLSLAILPAQTRSVWDGVYSKDQAKRGQAMYSEHCGSCHGDAMTGGESAPPLAGADFMANWNGLSAGDLFERIRKTMPLSKPGKLGREVNADILAYILSFNEFPTGETELPQALEKLKEIKIDAKK